MKKELLQELADKLDCDYISDLRYMNNGTLIAGAVEQLPVQDYSLHDWNDAVNYLTGEDAAFKDALAAKGHLVACLRDRHSL